MLVLALDSSTSAVSVAVVSQDGRVHAQLDELAGNAGEVALPMIDRLLRDQAVTREQLTGVAVGVGPGPYTSTRVGVMAATTIAHTLGIPAVGICSHDAIAAATVVADRPTADFVVATDARRREVYWAQYDPSGARISGPIVTKPAVMVELTGLDVYAGDGLDRYPELAVEHGLTKLPTRYPSAAAIAELAIAGWRRGERPTTQQPAMAEHGGDGAGIVAADQTLLPAYPLYLRRPDAAPPKPVSVHG